MDDSLSTSTILVVDDERGPRLALQLLLQRSFRVLTAESGEEALEVLKAEPIDAVTLDLKMPGLAGQNTLSMIRNADPDLPVIVITGFGSFDSAVKALQLHAFDYIAKPFDSRRIVRVVTSAVEERQRVRERNPEAVIASLEAVLEATDSIEERGSQWMTTADRAALDAIRSRVRALQDQVRPKRGFTSEDDLFAFGKEHV